MIGMRKNSKKNFFLSRMERRIWRNPFDEAVAELNARLIRARAAKAQHKAWRSSGFMRGAPA
jgi:hypothetical protein